MKFLNNDSKFLRELTFKEKLGLGLAALASLGGLAMGMSRTGQEYVGVNNTDCFGKEAAPIVSGASVEAIAEPLAAKFSVPLTDMKLLVIALNKDSIREGTDAKPIVTASNAAVPERCS